MGPSLLARVIAGALTLLAIGASFARLLEREPAAPPPGALQFDTVSHDCGDVRDIVPIRFTYTFRNVSNRVVSLSRTTGCGGFIPPTYSKRRFEPGEAGEVTVTLNPLNRRGPQLKTTIVECDDPVWPRYELALTANVIPHVFIEPSKIFFQEAMRGGGSTQTVTVTGDDPNFEITGIEGATSVFSVARAGTEPMFEGGRTLTKVTLELTLAKDAPLGTHNASFILTTNDPKAPKVNMPVAGTVVGDTRATPPGMLIRTSTPGTPFRARVQLDSRSARAFSVKSVDVDGPSEMSLAVDFEPSVQDGVPIWLVTLSGVTPTPPGQYRGTIAVDTDLPGEEPLTFNWIATVR